MAKPPTLATERRLAREEVEKAYQRARIFLEKNVGNYYPIVVQVRESDTAVHTDQFVICAVMHKTPYIAGSSPAHLISSEGYLSDEPVWVKFGKVCQWILDPRPGD